MAHEADEPVLRDQHDEDDEQAEQALRILALAAEQVRGADEDGRADHRAHHRSSSAHDHVGDHVDGGAGRERTRMSDLKHVDEREPAEARDPRRDHEAEHLVAPDDEAQALGQDLVLLDRGERLAEGSRRDSRRDGSC